MTKKKPSTQSGKPWTPRPYQEVALKFLLEHACAGLLLKPGLGKTASTLAAITFLKKRKLIKKVLIIAPVRVCYRVWPREIKKWADFNHLTIAIAHGKDKEAALHADVDIVCVNFEAVDWLLDTTKVKSKNRLAVTVNMKRIEELGFDVLVVDELSKFKHEHTGRFKAMKNVLHLFSRRWGLTGSPAPNGLIDLFGQCYILDQGAALGRFITHYRDEFFIPNKYTNKWKLQPGAEERIYKRIEPLMLHMGYENLDMPELIPNILWCQLPPAVEDLYTQFERDFITKVDDRIITAANAAAMSTKLRQVANGGIFLDPPMLPSGLQAPKSKRTWKNLHDDKTAALRDLVDELQGDPILVAYDFEHDLDRLRQEFGKDGVFACDYSAKQFGKVEDAWNAGEIPLLFGHPQSLSHGLNLQDAAQHVGWYALTWNREWYDQFIDRVWRQGNKFKQVFVHHFLTEGTIDEVIYNALLGKGSVEEALLTGIKRMAAERKAR